MAKVKRPAEFEYDVTLSFAGEDRRYVAAVAGSLVNLGVRVFYDRYEEVNLWGKDLYVHLSDVYRRSARYCVMFISKHYARKLWTNHERRNAQERAFKENKEYILPARFDSTPVPGLLDTVGYISLAKKKPREVATLIASKVVEFPRRNYFPLTADNLEKCLRKEMRLRSSKSIRRYVDSAYRLYRMFGRLTDEERELIFGILTHGCTLELPNNIHIELEMLRRTSIFTRSRIERIANAIRPLGFHINLRDTHHGRPKPASNPMVVLDWFDLNSEAPPRETWLMYLVAKAATSRHCEECGFKALCRLGFSQLSSKTASEDAHLIQRMSP